MPKTGCCNSRYFKYPAFFGGLVLAAGSVTSYVLALKIANACSDGINSLLGNLGSNFTLSDIDATVHFGNRNFSVNFEDIHGDIPSNVLNLLGELRSISDYCFYAPLTLGLGITASVSIALVSLIALTLFINDNLARGASQRGVSINAHSEDEAATVSLLPSR